jgi:hypothetical protein
MTLSPLESLVSQGFVRVDGPLTPLPRALTPAERGQGLDVGNEHCGWGMAYGERLAGSASARRLRPCEVDVEKRALAPAPRG